MATTLTTRIEPSYLNTQVDFALHCALKSIELFDTAIEKKKEITGCEAPLLALQEIGWGSVELLGRIALVVGDAFMAIVNLLKQEWSSAAYHGLCVVLLDPVDICAAFIAVIIRVVSSLLGICCPTLPVEGWRLAEIINHRSCCFSADWIHWINPTNGVNSENDIFPTNALTLFGEKKCVELDRAKKGLHTLRETETKLVRFVEEFVVLTETNATQIKNAEDAKAVYDFILPSVMKREKISDDILTAIENIDRLISDYFAFGKMSYRFC